MASGDMLLDSSGNAVLSDASKCPGNSGDLMLSNGSGDSCYCQPCTACSHGQSKLTVILSGTSACACGNIGGANSIETVGSADGTYCLPFFTISSGSCVYYQTFNGAFTRNYYGDTACTDLAESWNTFAVAAVVGPGSLAVYASLTSSSPGWPGITVTAEGGFSGSTSSSFCTSGGTGTVTGLSGSPCLSYYDYGVLQPAFSGAGATAAVTWGC